MVFSEAELTFLRGQPIGRLATVAPDGVVQNNPTSFHVDDELGVLDIGGLDLGRTKKFRNVERGSTQVAFVVDDVPSGDLRRARGVEIRGWAEALHDQRPYFKALSIELIRIHPRLILSWSIDPTVKGVRRRVVGDEPS